MQLGADVRRKHPGADLRILLHRLVRIRTHVLQGKASHGGKSKIFELLPQPAASQVPITPPSSLVMTTTAERGLEGEPLAVVGPF